MTGSGVRRLSSLSSLFDLSYLDLLLGMTGLRLTEDTELGSNESIKSDRSMAAQRAVGGQKCCQSSSASESASASAAA